ncbi:hypothetical protein F5Y09DRAFT_338825 [Xylaria sp. FL1042]|nr:hypothetical protein F5Y09DRAFT_338825 [Xylaria sp. FL1042]
MKAVLVSMLSLASVGITNPLSDLGVRGLWNHEPPYISWHSTRLQEVPSGAYCAPSHAEFLVYGKASRHMKRERRRAADCIRDIYTNRTYISGPEQFRTYGGKILGAPYGGTIGQPVHSPRPIDEELHEKLIEEHDYDEDGHDSQFDEITANMIADVDYLMEVVWEGQLMG